MDFSSVFLLLFVFTTLSEGWEIGKNYRYTYKNEMFLNSSQLTNERFGIVRFQWKSVNSLTGRMELRKDVVLDSIFQYVPIGSFQATFQAGQVSEIEIGPKVPSWHVDVIRVIVGLLQIPDVAKTEKKISVMEETVAGKCNTSYRKHTFKPLSAVLYEKRTDYNDCEYITKSTGGVFGANINGEVIARDSNVKIFLLNGYEMYKVLLEEKIEFLSGNNSVKFLNKIQLEDDLFDGKELY